jgi:hypothetical protein
MMIEIKVGDRIRNIRQPDAPEAVVLFIDPEGYLTVKYDGYAASDSLKPEDAEVITA